VTLTTRKNLRAVETWPNPTHGLTQPMAMSVKSTIVHSVKTRLAHIIMLSTVHTQQSILQITS